MAELPKWTRVDRRMASNEWRNDRITEPRAFSPQSPRDPREMASRSRASKLGLRPMAKPLPNRMRSIRIDPKHVRVLMVPRLMGCLLFISLAGLVACDRGIGPFDPDEQPSQPNLDRIYPEGARAAKGPGTGGGGGPMNPAAPAGASL